jgi:toxin ParE1/3/4
MLPYDLTRSAENDLEEIARYTIERWGSKKAKQYAAAFDACFIKLAEGDVVARVFSETLPHVHVTRCGQHYVFFLRTAQRRPCIIAVLHERMEILECLKDRLS